MEVPEGDFVAIRNNDYLSSPVGGRLLHFARTWGLVTSDQWVLQTIQSGYKLEFTSPPPSYHTFRHTKIPSEPERRQALFSEVKDLSDKAAITIVPPRQAAFTSTFFLTTKRSGEWRPILNLKPLNRFIRPRPFKMESLAAVLPELSKGWYAASIDLKDAYLHIPIHPSHRKWLSFCIDRVVYQFRVLPFGLSTAPRTFTRIVKVIAEYLRTQGHFLYVYLDDWLLTAPTECQLQRTISATTDLVTNLGFLINEKKSCRVPSQRVDFLGASLDFQRARASPSEDRIRSTTACARQILAKEAAPARLWTRLLGLQASMTAILPDCRRHMRLIQLHVLSRFNIRRDPMSKKIPHTPAVRQALLWWTLPENLGPGMPFSSRRSSYTLTTDASKAGWGAHMDDKQVSGLWSKSLAKNHINILELWAVHLALRHFLPRVRHHRVTVRCDNMSVVAYINKQGGTRSKSLCLQTLKLLTWCHRFDIELHAIHLPGEDNTLADALSRKGTKISGPSKVRGSSVEWHLNPVVCQTVFRNRDRPLIDLFANKTNKQLPTYCSWQRDPAALQQDAMSMSWENCNVYAFPPIPTPNCKMILIAPQWPRQPWFPRLLSLLSETPLILPFRRFI